MRFSEFYAPERQRELLAEAEQRRLVRDATAYRQSFAELQRGNMYRNLIVALIVVSGFVIGYASFTGSVVQASHNCQSGSIAVAANPELSVACRSDVGYRTGPLPTIGVNAGLQRGIEASAARYTGLAGYYPVVEELAVSTDYSANPELMAFTRFSTAVQSAQPSGTANAALKTFARTAVELERQQDYIGGR